MEFPCQLCCFPLPQNYTDYYEGYPSEDPLIMAARLGHEHCLKCWLMSGTDVNVVSPTDHGTALKAATSQNHIHCMKLLLLAGADADARCPCGVTALMMAINRESMLLLLKNGANKDDGVSDAIKEGNCDLLEVLIEAKANVNAKSPSGRTPLIVGWYNATILVELAQANVVIRRWFVLCPNVLKCIKMLIMANTDVNRGVPLLVTDLPRGVLDIEFVKECYMVLHAAGEMAVDMFSPHAPEFVKTEITMKVNLAHFCRETIRTHLLRVNPHKNLYTQISNLSVLPNLLKEYLLYNKFQIM